MRKLKHADIPKARLILAKRQDNLCPLCQGKLGTSKDPVLDHDHQRGFIRDVLCRNCNGIEGKVFNLARRARHKLTEVQWLENLVAYHKRHATPQNGLYLHPTFQTEAEKRLKRNAKARAKRKAEKK